MSAARRFVEIIARNVCLVLIKAGLFSGMSFGIYRVFT